MKSAIAYMMLGLPTFGLCQVGPRNPCVAVGATCDPIIPSFCQGRYNVPINLPCGPRGIAGVGCCWHAPRN
ncbi:hypothetical protein BB8028_0004g13420 [Beauveria bassiana]|uniref:Uncharacterized protein n=1 Tax=Beauveria bassiana TaxID=176275 RepID=A0A2S7YEV8_BEABA|nr:hypothetical protein BB8028_0004g13420 [Beauveria bassiana]